MSVEKKCSKIIAKNRSGSPWGDPVLFFAMIFDLPKRAWESPKDPEGAPRKPQRAPRHPQESPEDPTETKFEARFWSENLSFIEVKL